MYLMYPQRSWNSSVLNSGFNLFLKSRANKGACPVLCSVYMWHFLHWLKLPFAQPFAKLRCYFFALITYFALKFYGTRGQKVKKHFFKNTLQVLPILGNFLSIREVFNTIFENYKERSFQKWFWILSAVFRSSKKCMKKWFQTFLPVFWPTFNASFLVICLCSKLFNTILWGGGGPKGPQMPSAGNRKNGP